MDVTLNSTHILLFITINSGPDIPLFSNTHGDFVKRITKKFVVAQKAFSNEMKMSNLWDNALILEAKEKLSPPLDLPNLDSKEVVVRKEIRERFEMEYVDRLGIFYTLFCIQRGRYN